MFIVLMNLVVRLDQLDAFLLATLEKGHASLKENGMRRFEVLRADENASRFVIAKAFNTREDYTLHLNTEHHKQWLETTASMLAEPATSTSYTQLF